MSDPDVLVIDDARSFAFPAVYARTAREGLARLLEREWREVWLDYNLGGGETIEPVMRLLEDRAAGGKPLRIGLVCVHTSGPAEGDAMVRRLTPAYRVRRVVARAYQAGPSSAGARSRSRE